MKSWKKRLAVILSAAMVMTAGTGMPGYGRSSAVSLKTALASVRTEDSGGAVSGVKATSSDAEMLRATSSNAVAEVDGTEFKSLQEAVDAADGKTVYLLENLDIHSTGLEVKTGNQVTLDLNGHEILAANTRPGDIWVKGQLVLKATGGGRIYTETDYKDSKTGYALVNVYGPSSRLVMEEGTIEAVRPDPSNMGQFGISVQDGGEAVINGGTVKAGWYAVAGNGNVDGKADTKITINGGELISTTDYAIYHPQYGTLTINGGIVRGAAGAASFNRGTLIVRGGEITSEGTGDTGSWGDGTGNQKKAAINLNAAYGDVSMEIYGGVFTATGDETAMIISDAKHKVTGAIVGGTFSKVSPEMEKYLKAGYEFKDGTVQAQSPSASVGDRTFASLEDAFRGALDGETITMLKSVEETDGVMLDDGRELTVDLNGCDITFQANGPKTDHFFGVKHGSLRLTGSGTVAEKEGGEYFGPVYLWGSKDPEDASYTCLTVDEGVTLKGFAGIFVDENENAAYGVQVEMNGVIEAVPDPSGYTGYAIYVNGAVTGTSDNCPKILVGQNARIDSAGLGLYLAGYADTVIGGQAEINSVDGIEIRAGKLLIQEDAVIRATNTKTDVEGNPSGSTTLGSAIAVAQHDTKLPISVEVTGGTISGCIPFRESNPQGNSAEDLEKIELAISGGRFETIGDSSTLVKSDDFTGFITGGTYSGPLEEKYLADGYIQIKLENGDYMVAAEDGVSVSLDRNSMSMTVDQTETLKAEVYPGGTVSWASSDETVAAVDENGCVTAVGEGMAVITATVSIGGKTWSDQCTVTVTDVPAEGDGPEAEDGGATVIVPGPEAMEVSGKPEGVSDEAFHQAVTDAKEGVAGMAENTAVAGNPNAVSGIGEAVLAAGLLGENEKAEISLEQRLEHVEFAAELIKDADGTVTGVKLVPRKLVFDVSAFRTLLNEKDEPILSTKKPLNMDSSLMKRKYFTFRLPVPASVEERYANVEHEGEGVRQYTIAGSGNSRYIPVETWHLSRFTVTFTDQKLVPESHGGSGGGKTKSYGARGRWIQDAAGWWYQNPDRTWPSNTWIVLEWNGQNTWYRFNEKGYMVSGWYLDTDGNWYFLHNKEDGTQGHMYIGWKQIDGKWYYFRENAGGPQGSLLVNGVTPDGYTADGNGVCAEYPGR